MYIHVYLYPYLIIAEILCILLNKSVTDINKQVLKEHSKAFPVMIKLAEGLLKKVGRERA